MSMDLKTIKLHSTYHYPTMLPRAHNRMITHTSPQTPPQLLSTHGWTIYAAHAGDIFRKNESLSTSDLWHS